MRRLEDGVTALLGDLGETARSANALLDGETRVALRGTVAEVQQLARTLRREIERHRRGDRRRSGVPAPCQPGERTPAIPGRADRPRRRGRGAGGRGARAGGSVDPSRRRLGLGNGARREPGRPAAQRRIARRAARLLVEMTDAAAALEPRLAGARAEPGSAARRAAAAARTRRVTSAARARRSGTSCGPPLCARPRASRWGRRRRRRATSCRRPSRASRSLGRGQP